MTVTLEGRSDEPVITVSMPRQWRDPLFVLNGAELRSRGERSLVGEILCRHETATDFEHDAAAVASLDLVGITWSSMGYGLVFFDAYLTGGSWYDADTKFEPGLKTPHSQDTDEVYLCEDCTRQRSIDDDGPHLIMPFRPPPGKIEPQVVEIICNFRPDARGRIGLPKSVASYAATALEGSSDNGDQYAAKQIRDLLRERED